MIYQCPICKSQVFKPGKKPLRDHYPCEKCSTADEDTIYPGELVMMEPLLIKGGTMSPSPMDGTEKLTTTDDGVLRSFDTGATRDTAEGKLDPEGFTHPLVMEQFYKYMSMNRLQSDGKLRDSDNWQKGIPREAYMKSLKRHCDDAWLEHRGFNSDNGLIAALCGIMFNAMGYMHEELKESEWNLREFDNGEPTAEILERQERLANEKA